MKKIGFICVAIVAGLSLAGCNNLSSQEWHKKHDSSASSKVTVENSKNKSSSSHKDKNSDKDDELFDIYDGSDTQVDVSTATNMNISSMNFPDGSSVNVQKPQVNVSKNTANTSEAADQAVATAKAKYGDSNIHWNYMIDGSTGQPIKNPDGSYFVKGTADDGTMTGTQYSLRVYPDGTIKNN